VRQESPSAAAFEDVEDGVKDLTQAVDSGPPIVFGSRQMSFEACPFSVRKIGRVRLSHASIHARVAAPIPDYPFSDSFENTSSTHFVNEGKRRVRVSALALGV
jgi:hypothetical protein